MDLFLKLLFKEINQLNQQDYPWLDHKKLKNIQGLLGMFPQGLRNRKSSLHLSASAFVLNDNRAYFMRFLYRNKYS